MKRGAPHQRRTEPRDNALNVCARIFARCSRLLRLALFCMLAGAPLAHGHNAVDLKARHDALREQLANNQFQRPLYLQSKQTSSTLEGDIYALVEQPYAVVGPALQGTEHWCEILILHLNVKGCSASTGEGGERLNLSLGRKFAQPLADAYRLEFRYSVTASAADYLRLELNAEKGPLDTRDYRIVLELVALDKQRSFLHLAYSYGYGLAAQVAMQGYLSTLGRDKLGFSIVGSQANGEPVYIDDLRGVVERNTMRYYLAIDAYLGALSVPPAERLQKRLNDWYAGVERYPLQLHELERDQYLEMKRKEVQRQQAGAGAE